MSKPTYEALEQRIEQLEEREVKFRAVLESSRDILYKFNLETETYDYLSPSIEDYTGISVEEFISGGLELAVSLVHPEDRDRLQRHIEQLLNFKPGEEVAATIEYRTVHPGKGCRWSSDNRTIIYDDDGEAIAVVGDIRDITESKKAEEKLLEMESYQRALLNAVPDTLFLMKPDGTMLAANNGLANNLGIPFSDMAGKKAYELVSEEVALNRQPALDKALETGQPVTINDMHSGRYVESRIFPIKNNRGEVDYLAIFGRDITENEELHKKLSTESKNLIAIFNSTPNILVLINNEMHIEQCNQKGLAFAGKLEEEVRGLLGGEVFNCMHAFEGEGCGRNTVCDECPIRNRVESTFRTGDPHFEEECRKDFMIDGENRRLDLLVSTVLLTIDGEDKVLLSISDITNIKESEKQKEKLNSQLIQAQKMEAVGRLAGGVAHDFNNMLGVILGNTDMALEEIGQNELLNMNLTEIKIAANRSVDIVRQLLAFARKQTIAPKVVELNEAVENILKMLRRLIGEDIELSWFPGKKLQPVKIDPSQLDQILANLSVNARDAITRDGKLVIETDNVTFDKAYCDNHPGFSPGDFVQLTVSDNGCGMDEEIQDNMFEPFYTTKEGDKGTGLGLATVYGIVKQNGGFINVYSEVDKGTSFKIYLPCHIPSGDPEDVKEKSEPLFRGNECILLVEDELSILKMAAMILKSMGYTVLTANTPGEAINMAQEHDNEIHLLLTDVVMPKMNGNDLFKKLLLIYPNLKVLFMSGYTADVIAHHGVLDEGVNYIQKPFSRQKLSVKLREVLDATDT